MLAACDGGRPLVRVGGEVLGLAAAFLARGAARVVAPVLAVPDAATVPVMTGMHARAAVGLPTARALAETQLALHEDRDAASVTAAGFVCLGAG